MFCSNCGAELPDNARFCAKCGAQVLVTALPAAEYQKLMQARSAPASNIIPQVQVSNGYTPVRESPVAIYQEHIRATGDDLMHNVRYSIKNLSQKPIKYLDLFFQAYNRVNDPVGPVVEVRSTGPLEPGNALYNNSPPRSQYNNTISDYVFLKINIEFMDGMKVTVQGADVPSFKIPFLMRQPTML